MPGASTFLLPEFVSRFIAETPDVRVTLSTRSSPQIRNLIAAQDFEVGFCDMSKMANDLALYTSDEVPCICLCALSVNHPLANKEAIAAKDLEGEPMAALQPFHTTFRKTAGTFERSGSNFNVMVDGQYILPLLQFVEAGQACSIIDVLSAESYLLSSPDPSKVKFLPFTLQCPLAIPSSPPANAPYHSRPTGCSGLADLRRRDHFALFKPGAIQPDGCGSDFLTFIPAWLDRTRRLLKHVGGAVHSYPAPHNRDFGTSMNCVPGFAQRSN